MLNAGDESMKQNKNREGFFKRALNATIGSVGCCLNRCVVFLANSKLNVSHGLATVTHFLSSKFIQRECMSGIQPKTKAHELMELINQIHHEAVDGKYNAFLLNRLKIDIDKTKGVSPDFYYFGRLLLAAEQGDYAEVDSKCRSLATTGEHTSIINGMTTLTNMGLMASAANLAKSVPIQLDLGSALFLAVCFADGGYFEKTKEILTYIKKAFPIESTEALWSEHHKDELQHLLCVCDIYDALKIPEATWVKFWEYVEQKISRKTVQVRLFHTYTTLEPSTLGESPFLSRNYFYKESTMDADAVFELSDKIAMELAMLDKEFRSTILPYFSSDCRIQELNFVAA